MPEDERPDALSDPVDERLLRAEVERLDRRITGEARRLDDLRDFHISQDEERWGVHHREHARLDDNLKGRFETVNECREALTDLSRDMATRREVETMTSASHTSLETALNSLRLAAENRARTTLAVLGLVLTSVIVAVSLYGVNHQRAIVIQLPSGLVVPATTSTTVP